jgi:glutaredoxin
MQKLLIATGSVIVLMLGFAHWRDMKAVSPSTPVAQSVNQQPTAAEVAVHLRKIGAKMYGTYWCPYCTRQKEMFGQAFSQINYVECDPRGQNPQPSLCQTAGIQALPTWEINGRRYPGLLSLPDLARLSGYQK